MEFLPIFIIVCFLSVIPIMIAIAKQSIFWLLITIVEFFIGFTLCTVLPIDNLLIVSFVRIISAAIYYSVVSVFLNLIPRSSTWL